MKTKTRYRVAIIDDDPVVSNLTSIAITGKFPDVDVYTYSEPRNIPNMDIYFIDNDFDGTRMAMSLLKRIRKTNPDSLVIAMSATLDMGTIQNLMNQGCNGIWDKNLMGSQAEVVFDIMSNYMEILDEIYSENTRSLSASLKVMRDLLLQWNKRLNKSDK